MCKHFILIVTFATLLAISIAGGIAGESKITHAFLATGAATYIRDGNGKILWTYPHATSDGWALPSGNVLLALVPSAKYPRGGAIEVGREGKIVFEFKGTQTEVNTVQPVENDRVLLTEA